MSERRLVLGIGELLWDMLPGGPQLGGAPANFAVMSGRLGNHAAVLSRLGRDALATRAIETLAPLPVDTAHIQIDPAHATGSVSVTLRDGQPSYVIHQPVAWDALEATPEWEQLAARAAAICFGTLAQRSEHSRTTIQSLVAGTPAACVRVFDANLREPFYTAEVLAESIDLATILKVNDAELPLLMRTLDLISGPEDLAPGPTTEPTTDSLLGSARVLLGEYGMQLICITRGGQGSLLLGRKGEHIHPGVSVKIADTIGAGDAFTAALTHYYLEGASLAMMNEAGNRWGSWVASQPGAMPPLSDEVRESIATEISSGKQGK